MLFKDVISSEGLTEVTFQVIYDYIKNCVFMILAFFDKKMYYKDFGIKVVLYYLK